MILGRDGSFSFHISDQKPILRCIGVYHEEQGNDIYVEAKVTSGAVATLKQDSPLIGPTKPPPTLLTERWQWFHLVCLFFPQFHSANFSANRFRKF